MNEPVERKPLILVVDSQQEVLDAVAQVLPLTKFDCRCCNCAEVAIATAASTPPDLIISDINLHGHSGLQMCEQIKQHAALTDLPVMFLSGTQIPDIIRRSDADGGTYYLRKPLDPEVLTELVDRALAVRQG